MSPPPGLAPSVKICGLCRAEDAAEAAAAGAHYVGVILASGRTRSRDVDAAAAIYAAAPGLVRVGVFVDADAATMLAAAERLELNVLQLHGAETLETAADLRQRGLGVWKALRPRSGEEFRAGVERWRDAADALLVDGWSAAAEGGTGTRFDWDAVAPLRALVPPTLGLVMAGGLEPGNVAGGIAALRPDIVDVSSGVERAPGEKDPARVRAFIAAVRGGPPRR
ncbi:MAG TPA: phosphoribosylanthranilate isomerase [Longimicrobiales bacterium]|nr:phosphoribosylanthranilate isomerase [Longimicrobiales bacterium]